MISAYDKMPIRIELKGEPDEKIAERFCNSDKKLGTNIKSYTTGANCSNYLMAAKLQQYLLGGHCISISKKEFSFDDFIKANGGLVKLT